ncbi:hypothetical protein BN970_04603 [Mycolicibacterium conceptionense]|uniref:Head-to-tail adaptor n=1 Tax=Mycolicibacterium conceptionense TaxID=451644 RepID=A0A0U1DQX1_9MYCO|nr:hypothetical protein [Mycolicibacterium conceptionense]ORV25529.1 hypothetical protein AWB98_18045 [Mycolicibacterium conceptionense]CQD20039.1 hypothetical protein BN970_04603 [Mycolicibacterium conceptionense]
MPAVEIAPEDLEPFATIDQAKAEVMIEDALAMAALVAPCITTAEFAHAGAAKSVLRGAILRWHEAGQGGVQQLTAGSFSQTMDTRQTRRAMFWPSEIEQLQKMCTGDVDRGIWCIDTVGMPSSRHIASCSINTGGEHCSCGALLLPF